MPHYLLASVPIHGHVTPMLGIAADLVRRGERVTVLTGARFADAVAGTGSEFVPLPADADYDDRTLAEANPDRPTGIAGLRYDIAQTFLVPARAQYAALRELTLAAAAPPDVVLADPTFMGAVLLAGHDRAERPPVLVAGVLPLPLSSAHVAPFGLGIRPWEGPLNRPRNALLRGVVGRLFAPVQAELDGVFRDIHGRDAGAFVLDLLRTVDAVVQLSVPGFEYPRPDATVPIRFAGPIIPPATGGELPDWWAELEGDRPVVLVTQGTIANTDPTALVRPAIEALAADDVLVVVTTGGRPVAELGPLPDNVRAAEYLPYDRLFPHVDVFVTNGGYGGVHYALAHGVPLVVAGASEDKPEVAARVAWSGAGIDLRTGRPRPAKLRRAVRRILAAPRYRTAAARLAAEIRAARGVDELADVVAALGRGDTLART
ncbi:glycosyltransferase [Nocardia sp. NPDC057353]|uniref:glycosyltransferase n=1 Tax=Nocardia sp. NPDC057353 TaxID=3346104 RepID=UPI0036298E0A